MVGFNLFFSLLEIGRANQSVILSGYLEEDFVLDTIFVKVIVPLKSFNLHSSAHLCFLIFFGLHDTYYTTSLPLMFLRYVYRVFSRASRHTSLAERRSRAFKLYR